jgi:glycosyltransferase involved in cell wall biosynthesis
MIKVGIIIGDIGEPAGTERAVANLANSLSIGEDYQVKILSISNKNGKKPAYEINPKTEIEYLNLQRINETPFLKRIFIYFKIFGKIRKLAKAKQFDFLLGTIHVFNFILPFVTFGTKIKTIGCEHMSYYFIPKYSRLVRRILYPLLNQVVVLTEADKSEFLRFMKHVRVIPNSISFFPEKPAELENKTLLAVGRLTPQKGFDILLDISVEIFKQKPDWKLKIFGNGEMKSELEQKALQLKITQNIEFLPPTSEIQKEFSASSVYLLSSRWEGLPMVLLETMAAGLPPVCFDCPNGPKDVIADGEDGFLIEPGNIEKFTERTLQLTENQELRKIMGEKAREKAKLYSPETVVEKWNLLFKNQKTTT